MEPPRVRPGLGKRAGAVGDFPDERGKLFFQLVPRQAFTQSPHCRILPELFLQVPGQSVILGPNGLHVPGWRTHPYQCSAVAFRAGKALQTNHTQVNVIMNVC